jgi:hypothetical protein
MFISMKATSRATGIATMAGSSSLTALNQDCSIAVTFQGTDRISN